MRPDQSRPAFVEFLVGRGLRLVDLSVSDGIEAMLAFYCDVRAEGCELERGGDMVLFQWGTYDWGRGRHFELDITRQFILDNDEDQDISQLSLTFLFTPSPTFDAVLARDRWCHSLDERDDLHAFILGSAAYATAAATTVSRVDLDYSGV